MMSLGTTTLTGAAASAAVLAADSNRDHVTIQLQSAHPTYFGFGETAVTLQGISLINAGDAIEVTGPKARGAINALSAGNAVLGYETMIGVKYIPGPQVAS